MRHGTSTIAFGLLSLAACATQPEDRARWINFNWTLTPDNAERTRLTVESGDVILSWQVQAKATHIMDTPSGGANLVMARTNFGQLYCTAQACFEDRNGDGALDYTWSLNLNDKAPNQPISVNLARAVRKPIPFRTIETSGTAVFEQFMALVYSGPMEGLPKEDQTLLPLIGELTMGWFGGPKSPRTPDGVGWSAEQSLPLILADGVTPNTTVSPYSLTYKPLRAMIDGTLELEVEAKPVDNVDFDAEPEFDIEGRGKVPVDKIASPPVT